jgi:hypothetical protein
MGKTLNGPLATMLNTDTLEPLRSATVRDFLLTFRMVTVFPDRLRILTLPPDFDPYRTITFDRMIWPSAIWTLRIRRLIGFGILSSSYFVSLSTWLGYA